LDVHTLLLMYISCCDREGHVAKVFRARYAMAASMQICAVTSSVQDY
jgi:hypothetical protein